MNPLETKPDPQGRAPRDDDAELRRVEAMLRAVDPGREAAAALSARRRDRVLWSCRHPLLAWCMLHHAAIATAVAAAALALLFLWLVAKSREVRENNRIPDAVSAPVLLLDAPAAVPTAPVETP